MELDWNIVIAQGFFGGAMKTDSPNYIVVAKPPWLLTKADWHLVKTEYWWQ